MYRKFLTVTLLIFGLFMVIVNGQNDGRYKPPTTKRRIISDGRYKPVNDGRYQPDEKGKYSHRDPGYKPATTTTRATTTTTRATTTTTRRPTTTRPTDPPVPKVYGSGTGQGGGGWNIIQLQNDNSQDGYHYLFKTQNGILAEESGKVEEIGTDQEGLRSKGFYEYTGDDGILYRVNYVADTNGFVPEGDHIPKIPIEIRKLLDYLATQPPQINNDNKTL